MLPADRPVTGRDLEALRQKLGLLVNDFCFALGISMGKWSRIKQRMDAPLKEPGFAVLARLLDDNPDLCVVPRMPSAQAVFDKITTVDGYERFSRRAFSIPFGCDATASYHWLRQQRNSGPVSDRLSHMMDRVLREEDVTGLDKVARYRRHGKPRRAISPTCGAPDCGGKDCLSNR